MYRVRQSRVLPVPLSGEFGATSHSLVPHDGEVSSAGKVLGHSDSRVQIEHDMPPSTYTKHRVQPQSRLLFICCTRIYYFDNIVDLNCIIIILHLYRCLDIINKSIRIFMIKYIRCSSNTLLWTIAKSVSVRWVSSDGIMGVTDLNVLLFCIFIYLLLEYRSYE